MESNYVATVRRLGRDGTKFPCGSRAHHPEFGWGEVVAATGLMRVLEVSCSVEDLSNEGGDLPHDVQPGEVLSSRIVVTEQHDVHVTALTDWRACLSGSQPKASVASLVKHVPGNALTA